MLRQTPPLEAAEAFLVAASTASFRAAAAEMALSPSALSRRIQLLETFLGARLFDRSGPRAELTETGRIYLKAIRPAVESIRRASADLRMPSCDSLRIATSHSLAVEWLVPRMGRIVRDLGITIDLTVSREYSALRDQKVDLAIWGAIEPDDGQGDLLVTLDAVPVSAPQLNDGRQAPESVNDLLEHRLLDVRGPSNFWRDWLNASGYIGSLPEMGAVYDTNQLSYEAAATGMGVSLGIPLLANRFLEQGRLRACACAPKPTGVAYWIHHANSSARRSQASKVLVDWLKDEAANSKQQFITMTT